MCIINLNVASVLVKQTGLSVVDEWTDVLERNYLITLEDGCLEFSTRAKVSTSLKDLTFGSMT